MADKASKKAVCRKKKRQPAKKTQPEHDKEFSLKRVRDFFTTQKNWLIPCALIFVALFLAVSLRMQTASLPAIDDWAAEQLESLIRTDLALAQYQKNPNLPTPRQEEIVEKQLRDALKEPTYTVKTGSKQGASFSIEQTLIDDSEELKAFFRNEEGVTYLLSMDSWTHLRKIRNKVETGQFYDEIRKGAPWDPEGKDIPWETHTLAPAGYLMWIDLHLHVGYYFYKAVSIFVPGTTLEGALFILPIILASLAVIPAFLITKRVAGNLGGFVAAVIIAVHPYFLARTVGGFADTDAYVVVLPLFVAWLFLEAFETDALKKKIGLAAGAGFLMGITSFAWIAWWYILDFILATIGLFMVIELARSIISKQRVDIKELSSRLAAPAVLLITFFIASLVSTSIFSGISEFKNFIIAPFEFVLKTSVAVTSIWPNVYSAVGKLRTLPLLEILENLSFDTPLIFCFCLLGILLTLLRNGKEKEQKIPVNIKYALFLIIWLLGSVYASTKGLRFIMVIVPVFSIALGLFAGKAFQFLVPVLIDHFQFKKRIAQITLIIVLLVPLIIPIKAGMDTSRSALPLMNDNWYDSLTHIKMDSSRDAIITSWWDYGHAFKAISDRGVTFDGASQNNPDAHWVARMLLTEDETEAITILNKLDCGYHWVYVMLFNSDYDNTEYSLMLNDVLLLTDREEARTRLEQVVTPEEAEEMLQYIFCEPPEAYVITSDDMIEKAQSWAHIGTWDLNRASMYSKVRGTEFEEGKTMLAKEFGIPDNEAARTYYDIQTQRADDWIAPWQQYSMSGSCIPVEEDILVCESPELNFLLDRTTGETTIPTSKGEKTFYSVAFIDSNNDFRVVKETNTLFERRGAKFGAVVYGFPEPDKFILTIIGTSGPQEGNELLPGSMFTRLHFFKGHDLEHFELFDLKTGMVDISTWKLDWDGGLKSSVADGNRVWMNYIGWLDNGTTFDGTIIAWENLTGSAGLDFEDYETVPVGFTYSPDSLIPGVYSALEGMNEGEEKIITVLPEDGYGTNPTFHPLGNQTLNYKIHIVKIA